MTNKYIHNKTGRFYSIITDNFMMKQNGEWIKDLILYKAEYNNPEGEYFARTKEDFYANFTEVKPDRFTLYKWTFVLPNDVVISPETLKFVRHPVRVYEDSFEMCIGELPDYNDLEVLKDDLRYKTKEEVEIFIEDNIDPY